MNLKDIIDNESWQNKIFRDNRGEYTILRTRLIGGETYIEGVYLKTPTIKTKLERVDRAGDDQFVGKYTSAHKRVA